MPYHRYFELCLVLLLVAPLAQAAEVDLEKGEAVFEKQQCTVCHYSDRTEDKLGPGLKGLFQKARMNNGEGPTVESVTQVIEAGSETMPAFKELISGDDLKLLLDYLQSL